MCSIALEALARGWMYTSVENGWGNYVERAEWDWRQLSVRRAKCFANKDRVAPLSVDIRTHITSLLFPRIKFVFIQTDRYSKAINSQFVIMRTIIQPSCSKSKQTGLTCTILVHVADIRLQLVRFRPKWANVLQYHRRQRRSTAFQFLPDNPLFSPLFIFFPCRLLWLLSLCVLGQLCNISKGKSMFWRSNPLMAKSRRFSKYSRV